MSLPGPSGPPRKAGSLQNAAPVAHPQDNPRMNFNFPWRSSMPSPTEPGANPQPPIPLQIHPRMPDPPRPAAPRNAFSRGSNPAPPIPLQDLSRIPNHPQKAAPSNHPIHPQTVQPITRIEEPHPSVSWHNVDLEAQNTDIALGFTTAPEPVDTRFIAKFARLREKARRSRWCGGCAGFLGLFLFLVFIAAWVVLAILVSRKKSS